MGTEFLRVVLKLSSILCVSVHYMAIIIKSALFIIGQAYLSPYQYG